MNSLSFGKIYNNVTKSASDILGFCRASNLGHVTLFSVEDALQLKTSKEVAKNFILSVCQNPIQRKVVSIFCENFFKEYESLTKSEENIIDFCNVRLHELRSYCATCLEPFQEVTNLGKKFNFSDRDIVLIIKSLLVLSIHQNEFSVASVTSSLIGLNTDAKSVLSLIENLKSNKLNYCFLVDQKSIDPDFSNILGIKLNLSLSEKSENNIVALDHILNNIDFDHKNVSMCNTKEILMKTLEIDQNVNRFFSEKYILDIGLSQTDSDKFGYYVLKNGLGVIGDRAKSDFVGKVYLIKKNEESLEIEFVAHCLVEQTENTYQPVGNVRINYPDGKSYYGPVDKDLKPCGQGELSLSKACGSEVISMILAGEFKDNLFIGSALFGQNNSSLTMNWQCEFDRPEICLDGKLNSQSSLLEFSKARFLEDGQLEVSRNDGVVVCGFVQNMRNDRVNYEIEGKGSLVFPDNVTLAGEFSRPKESGFFSILNKHQSQTLYMGPFSGGSKVFLYLNHFEHDSFYYRPQAQDYFTPAVAEISQNQIGSEQLVLNAIEPERSPKSTQSGLVEGGLIGEPSPGPSRDLESPSSAEVASDKSPTAENNQIKEVKKKSR
jgi:hypothetical protein